jgi:hypothetical protein
MPTEVPGDPPDAYAWLDQDAGPLVRSFALTGGRAHSDGALFDLLAHVVATDHAHIVARQLQPEHRAIISRATHPVSVAELASYVDLPLGVVRVLLGDLVELDAIASHEPDTTSYLPDDHVLKAVIHALRTL